MTNLLITSKSDATKPLTLSPTDNAINLVQRNNDTFNIQTMMTTPLKEDLVTIPIEDTNQCLPESEDTGDIFGNRRGNTYGNNRLHHAVACFHFKLDSFVAGHLSAIKKTASGFLAIGYMVYFVYALFLHGTRQSNINVWPLVAITCVVIFIILVRYVASRFGEDISSVFGKVYSRMTKKWSLIKWAVLILTYGGMLAVVVVTVWEVPSNLVSLAGIIIFIFILYMFSNNPTQITWQPVLGGLTLQFYFALFILRWDVGYNIFSFLGKEINAFLSYSDVGATFVFGNKYTDHIFAMKVLPVVIFFGCFISILYYLGIMQTLIKGIAWVMRAVLGTTAVESLCAASNIFVGLMEASILIRPYVPLMTKSELHAVMVGGFATIAGAVLAAYISFGVPAEHLLCASVMSAPCALAVSKLLYPELEESKLKNMADTDVHDNGGKPQNILEAASNGASSAISLTANIAANLIAMLSLLAFINGALSWFGTFVCYDDLSFEKICSYLFMPVAYLMGVDWADAGVVGELVGIKTFLNEFIAYKELSVYINNRRECVPGKPVISERSEIIATYALCGFSNISAIGMQLGALGPMAPRRVAELAQSVVRALFGGIIACLLTASIAGLLMEDHPEAMLPCAASDMNSTITPNSSIIDNTTHSVDQNTPFS